MILLKDTWVDKVDGVDDVLSEDINNIAHHVIKNEEDINRGKTNYANSLIGKVIGNPVTFNDVDISPIAHDVNCYVRTSDGSIANGVDVIVTTGSESTTYTPDMNGRVTIPSVTKDTVITSIPSVVIEAKYNVDTNVVPRDYVKKTDYASETEAGVVKVKDIYGVRILYGALDVCAANKIHIDGREEKTNPLHERSRNTRYPIVPANLDYAVKAALSDCRITWTDEEKNAALMLLGLKKKKFQEYTSEDMKIVLPGLRGKYAQISSISGTVSVYHYNEYGYENVLINYPKQIVTDTGKVLLDITDSIAEQLPEFGVHELNKIYFDLEENKTYYQQEVRLGEYFEQTNDELIDGYYDSAKLFKLAYPRKTDITHLIPSGIIDLEGASYIKIVPSLSVEDVIDKIKDIEYDESLAYPPHYKYYNPTMSVLCEVLVDAE